jgi:hypothetical protein
MHKAYKKSLSETWLEKIMHANTRFAAQNSITQHTIARLIQVFKTEKKKRICGKRLNLVSEENSGPQLFIPNQVCWAQVYTSEQKALTLEQAEQDRIKSKKASALARRLYKEEQCKAHALLTSIRKQEVAERKAKKAAKVQACKDAYEAAKQACEA